MVNITFTTDIEWHIIWFKMSKSQSTCFFYVFFWNLHFSRCQIDPNWCCDVFKQTLKHAISGFLPIFNCAVLRCKIQEFGREGTKAYQGLQKRAKPQFFTAKKTLESKTPCHERTRSSGSYLTIPVRTSREEALMKFTTQFSQFAKQSLWLASVEWLHWTAWLIMECKTVGMPIW